MQTLIKLSERFWYQTPVAETDRPILGVVIGDHKTLMIDAGNSESHAHYFLEELKRNQIPDPDLVVLTHWHWDHIFGLSALSMVSIATKQTKIEMEKLVPYEWTDYAIDERVEAGIEIEFCADAIKQEFKTDRNIEITLPELTFDHNLEIDLGGVTCILKHVGGDHSKDSLVVYIKEEKILFLGDCIYPNLYSPRWNFTVDRTLKLLEELDQFDADTYILSHGKHISKSEYQMERDLLQNMAELLGKHHGDRVQVQDEYKNIVGRELNEDEVETLKFFINGYNL